MKVLQCIFALHLWQTLCGGVLVSTENHTYYIDSTNGSTRFDCGSVTSPCRSLYSKWNELRAELLVKGLTGMLTFLLAPGLYDVPAGPQPLDFTCLNTNISMITIKANPSFNKTSAVRIQQSFGIKYCNVVFEDVTFINIQQSLSFHSMKHVTIQNSLFENNKMKPLISATNVATVLLEHVAFRSSTFSSQLPSEAILFEKIGNLSLEDVTIASNKNLQVTINGIKNVRLYNLSAKSNKELVLKFLQSTVNAGEVVMENNHGNNATDAFVQLLSKSTGHFKNVSVTCNKYKGTKFGSVFRVADDSDLQCIGCTATKCPVMCGAGVQLASNIICEKCPAGTSAHRWEKKCVSCHKGNYASVNGSTDCSPCEKGTYCATARCATCKKCSGDFFTSLQGSSTCNRMSTLFIALLAVIILLIFTPIFIYSVSRNMKSCTHKYKEVTLEDESLVESNQLMQENNERSNKDDTLLINS